jgi:hypothetical protein
MVGLRCISTLALHGALLVQGYVTPHKVGHRRTFADRQSFQRKLPLVNPRIEDAASLDFDQTAATSSSSATESFNVTLADPSNFVNQSGDNSVSDGGLSFFSSRNITIAIVCVGALLVLSQLPQMSTVATVITTTYSKLLAEHPLPTKSFTSGALCGVSDVIAQFREPNRKVFNVKRLLRFAGKCLSLCPVRECMHPLSVICCQLRFGVTKIQRRYTFMRMLEKCILLYKRRDISMNSFLLL